MKINKLSAACALALVGVSGHALAAVTPFEAQSIGLVNGKDYVYLSGASAPQNFLSALATQLFEVGFITYFDNGGTPALGATTDDGNLYRAYFGTLKSDASIPLALRGKTVRLLDRAKGGSVWGVIPVARAEKIATLKMDAANCVLDVGIYRCAEVGVDPGTGAPNGQEVVSDFGVSDVAPNMFKGPLNVEFGASQLSTAEVGKLTSFAVNTLMMGLAVTNPIPATTYLSRAAYGSMLSGSVQDWTNISSTLAPVAGNQVVVCRRVPGSGTQTSYNWFFNNFPCTTQSIAGSGQIPPARMSDSASGVVSGTGTAVDPFIIDPSMGYTVIENSTSGNVRDCLKKASTGGIHTFKDEEGKSYSVNFGAAGGYGAIGVVSLDSRSRESGWSFRNMDGAGNSPSVGTSEGVVTGTGVAPTKANLIEGNYDFAAELTMQYRNTTVNGVAPLPATSLAKAFVDMFIQKGGQPAFNTVAWTAALPSAVNAPGATNVAKATRFGNMCKPLLRL